MVREPAVTGRFYPAGGEELGAQVRRLLGDTGDARRVVGVMAPHAGYVYSGAVAGETWAHAELPQRAVVLCPNHTGRGARVALWPPGGAWRTPLGEVPVDAALTGLIEESGAGATFDVDAHRFEHALEVELPFMQARRPDVRIAALCLSRLSFAECETLGKAIARSALECGEALVVASTDMSHYLPAPEALRLDARALERVAALDARGLHELVESDGLTMCGYVPTTVALVAACELGATRGEVVRYANSGEASGDYDSVVGYAGALFL